MTDSAGPMPVPKTAGPLASAFTLRVATFYGALFVCYGMHVPYTPVWLDWRGLSAAEISIVMAAPFFVRLVITPAVALAADRRGNHRQLLIGLAWASLVIALALSQAATFWPILALAVALIVCNSTIMPLTETVAVAGVRRAGLDYGRMRLWGSLSFVAASFAGGIAVAHSGGGAGVWLVAIGCLLTVAAGLAMGIATLIAGWIFSAYGSASYFSMAVVSALALLAAVRLLRIWNGSELAAVTPSVQPT